MPIWVYGNFLLLRKPQKECMQVHKREVERSSNLDNKRNI